MKTYVSRVFWAWLFISFSSGLQAQDRLGIEQAIELALAHDPRIDEKQAFVRKAQGLLQEAEGSEGFRYSVDSFLALSTGVDGGFYEGGQNSCSNNCEPRDDLYDLDDGLSLWAGLTFSIVKPLATFGRLENYQEAAQRNIAIKQQDVNLQRDEVALQVVKAYYGYLTARDSRLLLEDTRNRLEAALDLVNDWLEDGSGEVSQSDKYALESGLGLIDNFMAEATGLEQIAMAGLRLLTGLEDETIELAGVSSPSTCRRKASRNGSSWRWSIAPNSSRSKPASPRAARWSRPRERARSRSSLPASRVRWLTRRTATVSTTRISTTRSITTRCRR